MCVVGYDDRRQAIRLMNSWGRDWADGGYCWVSYDLFDKPASEEKPFCKYALVLFDGPTLAVKADVKPRGRDSQQYSWRVSVEGCEKAIARLAAVEYSLPEGYRPKTVRREDPADKFALASSQVSPQTSAKPIELSVQFELLSGRGLPARKVVVPCGQQGSTLPQGSLTVPNVVGERTPMASLRLIGLGLKVRVRAAEGQLRASAPAGKVLRQVPAAGTTLSKGSTVTLIVP